MIPNDSLYDGEELDNVNDGYKGNDLEDGDNQEGTGPKADNDIKLIAQEMLDWDVAVSGKKMLYEGVDALSPWERKVDTSLIETYQELRHGIDKDDVRSDAHTQDGYVAVGAISSILGPEGTEALLCDLEDLGLKGTAGKNSVSGLLPIESIPAAVASTALHSIGASIALTNEGSAEAQSDEALQADVIRSDFGIDGSGVKIGILSDSYNNSATAITTEADDIANGDLPGVGNPLGNTTPVKILDDLVQGTDEGRGMAQIIHDIAPGAELSFHTAGPGISDFAQGIRDLADDGADVIVDDILYGTQPFYQDGEVSQAVDEVAARGVKYYSAVANYDGQAYESDYRGVPVPGLAGEYHDFDPDPANEDARLLYEVPAGEQLSLSVQWDEPFASSGGVGSASDLNAQLVLAGTDTTVGGGIGPRNNIGGDAVEYLETTNPDAAPAQYELLISLGAGPAPNLVKVLDFDGRQLEYVTPTPTVVDHMAAEGAQAVGAAFYQKTPEFGTEPPVIEPFSTLGPKTILFDDAGNRLAEPEIRQAPDFVAADGVDTTFFGSPDADGTGFPNFFGTSAAAPAAAAVAALLQEAFPAATPDEINVALQQTAIDMDAPGVDDLTGFGLIQADAAYAALSEDKEPPKDKCPDKEPPKDKCPDDYKPCVSDDDYDGQNIQLTMDAEAGYQQDYLIA